MKKSCFTCKHRRTNFHFGYCNLYSDKELQKSEKKFINNCYYYETRNKDPKIC